MGTIANWIPVMERPLTSEEKDIFGNDFTVMLDGILPKNGQEVLVSGKWGVDQTTFYNDEYGYFEGYEEGEVFAWAMLPNPYRKERSI